MPEVSYQTDMNVPLDQVWDFVKDMNNWAPMLTGYQGHEVSDDRHSVWTLKGDVGILSRTVKLDVNITEWVDAERVCFTLEGLNEAVEGDGTFEMKTQTAIAGAPALVEAPPKKGLVARMLEWFFRVVFKKKFGEVTREIGPPKAGGATLIFRLRMDAGGPTAPLVNAMLEPALLPATEDLGNKIAAHLESAEATAA